MSKYSKILIFLTLFSISANWAAADRGGFKRKKSRITLNLVIHNNLKTSILTNLRSGEILYRGSHSLSQSVIGNNLFESSLITYKKGNTVYVLPLRHKILIPQFSASGYKVAIRP